MDKKRFPLYSNKHLCNTMSSSNTRYKSYIRKCKIDFYAGTFFWIMLLLFVTVFLPILLSGKRRQFNIDKTYDDAEYNTINAEIQTYIKANSDTTKNKNKKLLTVSLLKEFKMSDHCRIPFSNITIKLTVGTFIVVKFNKKLYFVNELHLEKRNKK
jgi:hypothetical protein